MKAILRIGMFAMGLVVAVGGAAFAQSASESMHEAGKSAESAIKHAYKGTATAVDDTALTAKVKAALHDDKITSKSDIHVTTTAGVVALHGAVASKEVSAHAEQIARDTKGVKGVRNRLMVP